MDKPSGKKMKNISIPRLPLLGSRANGEVFQYILLALNEQAATISIPTWVVSRTVLEESEAIYLHLEQLLKEKYLYIAHLKSLVQPVEMSASGEDAIYHLYFASPLRPTKEEHEPLKEDKVSVLIKLIKDSYMIKCGVHIYLKHIIPFFSRITKQIADYETIKDTLLLKTKERVFSNGEELKKLYEKMNTDSFKEDRIPEYIDLDSLRDILESEIDFNLFRLTFFEDADLFSFIESNYDESRAYTIKTYLYYLGAIKGLENRLYSNYNQIIAICS